MWLNKVLNKLVNGMYFNYYAVIADLYRVFINCFLFNEGSSKIVCDARSCLDDVITFHSNEIRYDRCSNGVILEGKLNDKTSLDGNINEDNLLNNIFYEIETEKLDNSLIVTILKSVKVECIYWDELILKAESNYFLTVGHFNNEMLKGIKIVGDGKVLKDFRSGVKAVWRMIGGYFGENVMRICGLMKV
jgi:hypothetical protein